ncbi:MAG TPA: rhodanese-like domain-containing protein [Candidatus Binatia bacterium]|nr:rhodanese-like domain-containing protein [Candidatus Binatia bacterium]
MDPYLQFLAQHPVLSTALGAIVVLVILNEMSGALTGDRRVTPLEAVRLINDRNAVVLDLRAPAEYKRGHILHAVNLPHGKLDERLAEVTKEKERPVVLVCALGGVAPQAAHRLKRAGLAEVYSLKGGLNGWLGASLPVTSK